MPKVIIKSGMPWENPVVYFVGTLTLTSLIKLSNGHATEVGAVSQWPGDSNLDASRLGMPRIGGNNHLTSVGLDVKKESVTSTRNGSLAFAFDDQVDQTGSATAFTESAVSWLLYMPYEPENRSDLKASIHVLPGVFTFADKQANIKPSFSVEKLAWHSLMAAKLKRMDPSVQCSNNSMTLKVNWVRAPHFLVAGGEGPPVPLSQMPSQCGFSVRRSRRDVHFVAPYQGCHVTQQHGNYVLPLRLWGAPMTLSCPVALPPPSVSCFPSGMVVNIGGITANELKVKVSGVWEPLQSVCGSCGLAVAAFSGGLTLAAPYHEGLCIEIKDEEYVLSLLIADGEFLATCPSGPDVKTTTATTEIPFVPQYPFLPQYPMFPILTPPTQSTTENTAAPHGHFSQIFQALKSSFPSVKEFLIARGILEETPLPATNTGAVLTTPASTEYDVLPQLPVAQEPQLHHGYPQMYKLPVYPFQAQNAAPATTPTTTAGTTAGTTAQRPFYYPLYYVPKQAHIPAFPHPQAKPGQPEPQNDYNRMSSFYPFPYPQKQNSIPGVPKDTVYQPQQQHNLPFMPYGAPYRLGYPPLHGQGPYPGR